MQLHKFNSPIQMSNFVIPFLKTGIADCMKKMYRTEGFAAFWKGIVPPILVETPKRAVKVCRKLLFSNNK